MSAHRNIEYPVLQVPYANFGPEHSRHPREETEDRKLGPNTPHHQPARAAQGPQQTRFELPTLNAGIDGGKQDQTATEYGQPQHQMNPLPHLRHDGANLFKDPVQFNNDDVGVMAQ